MAKWSENVSYKYLTYPDKNKGLRFSNSIFSFWDLNYGELCWTLTLCHQFSHLLNKERKKIGNLFMSKTPNHCWLYLKSHTLRHSFFHFGLWKHMILKNNDVFTSAWFQNGTWSFLALLSIIPTKITLSILYFLFLWINVVI